MTGTQYLSLLVYFNTVVATGALVLRYLALYNNGNRQQAGQWAMFAWISHVWLFYLVSTIRHSVFDLQSPSLFMSAWASALLLHALGVLAMDAYYHLKKHGYWERLRKGTHNGEQPTT